MELAYRIVNQNQYKSLTHSYKDHNHVIGINGRNPRCTQAAA
jgi:hypothetical protein